MHVEIIFICISIAFQHYISRIKHVISREVSRLNDLLCNQISVIHDVGDNCWTFQSLNAQNLPSTDVHYNYPVYEPLKAKTNIMVNSTKMHFIPLTTSLIIIEFKSGI